jgi:SAM-dependent methyltransferase
LSFIVKPLIAIYYKGSKYTDPIDGSSFGGFLPYGYHKVRKNALSPSTYSLERHRLLWLFLKTDTNFFSAEKKVLHFAPEQAFYKRFRDMENLDYTTTDLESPMADVKADICQLPFESNGFDVILCNHVLEHIPDDLKALKELFRVMKPGGMGIFQIPLDINRKNTFEDNSITDPKKRAKIFGQYDHVRIYGMDYFERLESCGFEVEKVDFTKTLSDAQITKYCLSKGELIPVVYKPL